MKNKNKTVWGTRFNNPTSKIFENIGASIDIDKRLFDEDIFSSISSGSYYFTGGWQIKAIYSLIIGFIISASTIWNAELNYLQSFSWLIGAITSWFTYYLLASE